MTDRMTCRVVGHDLARAPSFFNAQAWAAWIGEGRTDECRRCGVVRIIHPNGRRTYTYA